MQLAQFHFKCYLAQNTKFFMSALGIIDVKEMEMQDLIISVLEETKQIKCVFSLEIPDKAYLKIRHMMIKDKFTIG